MRHKYIICVEVITLFVFEGILLFSCLNSLKRYKLINGLIFKYETRKVWCVNVQKQNVFNLV